MAFLEFKNVRIAGISAGVPLRKVCNLDIKDISADYDSAAFVETTGVLERRIDEALTTSDLCVAAAEKLFADLGWDKSEVGGGNLCVADHRLLPARYSLYRSRQAWA